MNSLLLQLLIGPMFLAFAIIFKLFPPKSINGLYGYRTSYSMRSQEVWDEGNRFSFNLMVGIGVIVLLTQAILYFTMEGEWQLLIPTSLLVVLLVAMIPVTEAHLRKHFDEEGKPRILKKE